MMGSGIGISPEVVWVVLFVIGSVVLSVGLVYAIIHFQRTKLVPIANQLGGRLVTSFWQGAYLSLDREGYETRITLKMGSKNSPPYLIIRLMMPQAFDLTVARENFATRKLSDWGLMQDVKVGEPMFDDKFLIRSGDPMRAQYFFQDPGRREAMEYLFSQGFNMFRANRKALQIMKPNYKKEDLDPERIRICLEKIRQLELGEGT